jgi:sugar phosphate isomerase/epimerase
LAKKGFRVAYENWCWATYAPTWKAVWQIVEAAQRPNLGLCLDTFQSAAGEWGDPTTKSGLIESVSKDRLAEQWRASLEELTARVPPDKIFLLQISDAYHMDPPMDPMSDASGNRPRSRWSHHYRPLPCDGGYLPVGDFLQAVLKTGFRGWLSIEVFEALENRASEPEAYAKSAMASLHKLMSVD